jgi:DNA polymerase-3 subunit alpha
MLNSLGLLKVDFLGLITLTVMARACDLIEKRHGIKYDLSSIPLADARSFELLGSGQTAGVFQVEGGGMTRWLVQMKPQTLDHVIAMVALYRPGPMQFIPDYIARMHGEATVEYRHEALRPIFQDTYGIPVYQEQLMNAAVKLGGYTPQEADDLRKAISKKIGEKLRKHREKFVKGAVKNGIPDVTADQIFTDWEEFARYGFNKSHSADYGVLAVQTAFLKANYPAEYMSSLMSSVRGQTEKIALYISDARSMGVPVLPPDINASEWDFAIEDVDTKPAIRFGFGAIKNVGENSIQVITEARKHGPFKDLNSFARRVDLRAVGKRALECLVKVGALDAFGPRGALLDSLERIVLVSTSHFRAADAGQLSLFGAEGGVSEEIHLLDNSKIEQREMLNWERELIGLYISDHPLTPYQATFVKLVSYFSGQLSEAQHEEKVRVAGLITAVRPYSTKAGKPMGFVTLEDIQGNIELVLFPRTWAQCQPILEHGKIVLVEGKVDAQSSPPKILVDAIKTDFKMLVSLDEKDTALAPPVAEHPGGAPVPVKQAESQPQPTPVAAAPRSAPATRIAEPTPTFRQASPPYQAEPADGPPPPDNFPDGWDSEWQPSFENAQIAARPDAEPAPATPAATPIGARPANGNGAPKTEPLPPIKQEAPLAVVAEALQRAEPRPMQSLYVPLAEAEDKNHRPQQITVMLRPTGDQERDKRRIKSIYGTLISFHGRDRFSFQIFENGKGHLLDFPNDTTRICPEMFDRLKKLMGEESWRVEAITFQ